MTVTIRPDDEQLIVEAIRTGAYQNADEVIARALEVLRSDEQWLDESRSAIGEKINRAFGAVRSGTILLGGSIESRHGSPKGSLGARTTGLNAPLYEVSAEAQDDLFGIWKRIADDSSRWPTGSKASFIVCLLRWAGCRGKGTPAGTSRAGRSCFSLFTHFSSFISLMLLRSGSWPCCAGGAI